MSRDTMESFIGRWSRMKQDARAPQPAPPIEPDAAPPVIAPRQDAIDGTQPKHPGDPAPPLLTEADFADVDFTALDFNSEYARFMGSNVPDAIRNQALRQLWTSHPAMTEISKLDHYIDDYTDAAVAVPNGMIKTAYKFGQGFLSDAEAAEWDQLGKPIEPDKIATGTHLEADPRAALTNETAAADAALGSTSATSQGSTAAAMPRSPPPSQSLRSPAAHAAALAAASVPTPSDSADRRARALDDEHANG